MNPYGVWRTISDGTYGDDTPNFLGPPAVPKPRAYQRKQRRPGLEHIELLKRALLWKKNLPSNELKFFTISLLFALQLACRKRAMGERDIYIIFVNTKTATTPDGESATFHSVNAVLNKHGATISNRGSKSTRDYWHEYVTMTPTVPGAGSCFVSLDALISNGLFQIFPEFEEANDRNDARLHLTYIDLQKYWFQVSRQLTKEKIDIAAKLAFSFEPCTNGVIASGNRVEYKNILAAFLGLQQRDSNDLALRRWTKEHMTDELGTTTEARPENAFKVIANEVEQCSELVKLFVNRNVRLEHLQPISRLPLVQIETEKAKWRAWWHANMDEYRATRPDRRSSRHHEDRYDIPRSSTPRNPNVKRPSARSEVGVDRYRAPREERYSFEHRRRRYEQPRDQVRSGGRVEKDKRQRRRYRPMTCE